MSGVTEEGYLPGVPVCLVSVTGSAVRVGQGVFSVFFVLLLAVATPPGTNYRSDTLEPTYYYVSPWKFLQKGVLKTKPTAPRQARLLPLGDLVPAVRL